MSDRGFVVLALLAVSSPTVTVPKRTLTKGVHPWRCEPLPKMICRLYWLCSAARVSLKPLFVRWMTSSEICQQPEKCRFLPVFQRQ
ncbi:MAG: hypothetical protein ICV63_10720 [Coleofasciculus sp. Co-bin14]|nr:hypothetical protein [Coleofasciculus sp. Co-bin14]